MQCRKLMDTPIKIIALIIVLLVVGILVWVNVQVVLAHAPKDVLMIVLALVAPLVPVDVVTHAKELVRVGVQVVVVVAAVVLVVVIMLVLHAMHVVDVVDVEELVVVLVVVVVVVAVVAVVLAKQRVLNNVNTKYIPN